MKYFLMLVVAVLAVVQSPTVLAAKSLNSGAAAVDALPVQPGWVPNPANPIIKAGDLRPAALWNDPSVLREGTGYVMYMTTSVDKPFQPPILPFRAVSKDGLNWALDPAKPLINPTGTGYVGMETPSVVKFKNTYHMFYSLIHKAGTLPAMAIGHAYSRDGITWQLDKKGQPLIKATGNVQDWNGYLVGEPGAVVFNNKLYLYFVAVGARPSGSPPQLQQIALAISNDGFTFDTPRIVLKHDEALYPPASGFNGYSTPSAVVYNNQLHLFHNITQYRKGQNPEWYQVALGHAVSADGLTFTQDRAVIFKTSSFDWTSGGIISPSVLFEDGRIRMWFAGHMTQDAFGGLAYRGWAGREFGIGYAEWPIPAGKAPKR